MAFVRLNVIRRPMRMESSRSTTCSLSAASEVTSLMVEQGMKPFLNASFWLTTVRTRPLDGSTATTLPFIVPRAATAARRTERSSPSMLSPMVGSTGGALFRYTAFLNLAERGAILRAELPDLAAEGAFLVWAPAKLPQVNRPARASEKINPFIRGAYRKEKWGRAH